MHEIRARLSLCRLAAWLHVCPKSSRILANCAPKKFIKLAQVDAPAASCVIEAPTLLKASSSPLTSSEPPTVERPVAPAAEILHITVGKVSSSLTTGTESGLRPRCRQRSGHGGHHPDFKASNNPDAVGPAKGQPSEKRSLELRVTDAISRAHCFAQSPECVS